MSTSHRHGTHPYDIDALAHRWHALQHDAHAEQAFSDFLDGMEALPDDVQRAVLDRLEELYPIPPHQRHMDPFRALERMRRGESGDAGELDDHHHVFLAQTFASTCPYGGCHVCADFLRQYPPPDFMEQQPAR